MSEQSDNVSALSEKSKTDQINDPRVFKIKKWP